MSSKYNIRGTNGQFVKVQSSKQKVCCGGGCGCSQSAKIQKSLKIVDGRLYNWKNNVVRVKGHGTSQAVISLHKTINGIVPISELALASKEQVDNYLNNA